MIGRRNRWPTWAGACVAAVAMLVPSAAGAATKEYTVHVSPSSLPSGAATQVAATITNKANPQLLGAVNITPPAGYDVTAAGFSGSAPSGASASVTAGVVQLRNLSLAPNASVTVSMTTAVGCAAGSGVWQTAAKQSNDFNGTGNDFTLTGPASDRTTAASGTCGIAFATQPADVNVGEAISTVAHVPGAGAIKVRLTDGAGGTRDVDGVQVTMSATGPGTLGGTLTASTVDGVASFSDLVVDQTGTYTLTASSSGTSATSNSFVAGGHTVCENNQPCSASQVITGIIPGTTTPYRIEMEVAAPANPNSNIPDDGGTLTASFNTFQDFSTYCGSYRPRGLDVQVWAGPEREKVVKSRFSASLMGGAAASVLEDCSALPTNFRTGLFTMATNRGDLNGDGHPDYVGLLPDCFEVALGLVFPPPCVASRQTLDNGDAVITSRYPADPKDPARMP